MKITAVIPVRKGSQRVPNKNLRTFADTTLLELKIQTLLQVPEIDEIVVNTDSEEAIEMVNRRYTGGGKNAPPRSLLCLVTMQRQRVFPPLG